MKLINGKVKVTAGGYQVNAVIATPDIIPSTPLPLVIFFHGSGESGTDITKMYKQGLPKVLNDGYKPPFDFIMYAPQAVSYGVNPDWLPYILADILTRYNIDKTRIYVTGLSAGGWATYGTQTNVNTNFGKNFAAILPLSAATQDVNKSNVGWFVTTQTPVRAIVGALDYSYAENNQDLVNSINGQVAGLAKFYSRSGIGHGGWIDVYNGVWKDETGKTVWDWLWSKTRSVAAPPKTVKEKINTFDDFSHAQTPTNKLKLIYTLYSDFTTDIQTF